MTRASVIIVSWNGELYLEDCLRAIEAQISPSDEIIVVDNCSADDSPALVRERFPRIRLFENERNLGFAGGCNVGLRAAQGEYLLLVNQDVTVQAGWLEAMIEALAPTEVGAVGCKLLYPDGTIQHAGGIISYPLALPGHYGYHEPDQKQWDVQREVDYVTGAAMGLKRAVLNEIGLFDEKFFPACYEETDLCFRVKAAGYQVIYTPTALGIHHETTTTDRESTEYNRWMNRGRLRFVLKHYTADQFHDEFVPVERAWLAELTDLALRQGARAAYLDTVLSLRGVPKSGVLAEEGSEGAVAEALIDLRQVLVGFPEESHQATPSFLVNLPWGPSRARASIFGTFIRRLHGLWDSVWRLQEKLAVVQEILVYLDRELTERHRLQAEATYRLREQVDALQSRVQTLEEGLPAPSSSEER
jgi:GT2 family glycosyltransferase